MNETTPSPGGSTDGSTPVKDIEAAISNHPFFAGLAPAHVTLLARSAMRMRHPAGHMMFREGEPANRFYLIESGEVSLETARPDEPAVLIQHLSGGDVLGWSWLLPPHYWQFDARVTKDLTTLFFYGTRLREACEADPGLGYELMKRVSHVAIQRLQATRRALLASRRGAV